MSEATDWKTQLPEDLRAEPMFKDIPDVATLAKVAKDSKSALGSSIRVPGPEAKPEDRKAFVERLQKAAPELVMVPEDEKARGEVEGSIWSKLGRPADAKGYEAPKDLELPPEVVDALRIQAVEEGLTKGQFAARAKRAAAEIGKVSQSRREAQAVLKRELGAAYEERTTAAAAAAEKLGFPAALVQDIRAGAVDAKLFGAFAAIAKGFGERAEVGGQGQGVPGRLTPAEASQRMAEIRGRPEYFNRSLNPGLHDQLRAKMAEYAEQAYAET
jgi:hypothetical protein